MIRRLPIIPTILVLAAAGVMVALGFWQLGRADEKAALIARYEAALQSGDLKPFPGDQGGVSRDEWLFHPTAFDCTKVLSREAISGRSARGQAGYAHIARCQTERGPADVLLGWSRDPAAPAYEGGAVEGLIVRGGADGARVQSAQPLAGLGPLAEPDPNDLPNNHLAYAGQWFFFALTALVIYFLALRSRLAKRD
ncbi:SURF1 family protein [Qipengyuania nanhaisediminis]|uniref:SURF1 family protein n=1 Tax=Qipengyuania nanhaisediminis TaxID=604088 RepID=UPI0038B3AD52